MHGLHALGVPGGNHMQPDRRSNHQAKSRASIQRVGGTALEQAGVRAGTNILSLGAEKLDERTPLLRAGAISGRRAPADRDLAGWRDAHVEVTSEEMLR